MRWFVICACLALAVPVAADSKIVTKQPAASAQPRTPAKQLCKRKVVGKKIVCEFEASIVVSSQAPRPKVIIVQDGGRKVTGRPRVTDPIAGLPRQLEK